MNLTQLYRRFLKSWVIDFVLLFVVITGILSFIFKEELVSFASTVAKDLSAAYQAWEEANKGTPGITDHLTIRNVVLLTVAIGFMTLFWNRVVWRMRLSKRLTAAVCPKCSHPLSRIRRTTLQKSFSFILPVRRYYCHNCHWKGIKVKSFTSDDQGTDLKIKAAASRNLSATS